MFDDDEEGSRRDEEIDDILDRYNLDVSEGSGRSGGGVESREYQEYKEAERKYRERNWYEKLVENLSFFRFDFEDMVEDHRKAIRLLDYDLEPQQIVPAALVVGMVSLIVPGLVFFAGMPTIFLLGALAVPFATFYYIMKYPMMKAQQRVISAAEDLILGILYMAIYMQSSPSLEGAISFASRHLEGPVATDFKLMLWRLDVREYTTVEEALEEYSSKWRPYNKGFVESLDLLRSATHEANEQKRKSILSEAIDRLLGFTQDQMNEFASGMKMPVMALHGIGILLPVLGIILFPMIATFMGGEGMVYYLSFMYNLVLPVIVYIIMRNLLLSRPLSLSSQTGKMVGVEPGKMKFSVLGRELSIPVIALTLPLFIALAAWPGIYYFEVLTGARAIPLASSNLELLRQMMAIVAVSIPAGIHLILSYKPVVEKQEEIREMEEEFPEVLFELGKSLDRGKPVEIAVQDAAEGGKELALSQMFRRVSMNIREKGMTFSEALFDPDYGALKSYPSRLMGTVMEIIAESTQKGTAVAASASQNISDYLKQISDTQKRLEELLEESLSSIKFLGFVLAPVIAGVAVGMGSVISLAFYTIGEIQPTSNTTASSGGQGLAGGTPDMLSVFNFQDAIAPGLLQLVVGIYLIEIGILIGLLYVRLEEGKNRAKRNVMIGKLMMTGIPFYIIVVFTIVVTFGSIIQGVAG